MLKNLIKLAVRNLLKDKVYSLINVLGLTIGITCSLFLLMCIIDELSYDRFQRASTHNTRPTRSEAKYSQHFQR